MLVMSGARILVSFDSNIHEFQKLRIIGEIVITIKSPFFQISYPERARTRCEREDRAWSAKYFR